MKAIIGFSIGMTLAGSTLFTGGERVPVSHRDTPERSAVPYDDVQRVLDAKCVGCHSGPEAARGLRLDSWQALTAGSDHG